MGDGPNGVWRISGEGAALRRRADQMREQVEQATGVPHRIFHTDSGCKPDQWWASTDEGRSYERIEGVRDCDLIIEAAPDCYSGKIFDKWDWDPFKYLAGDASWINDFPALECAQSLTNIHHEKHRAYLMGEDKYVVLPRNDLRDAYQEFMEVLMGWRKPIVGAEK